jgi:hypothetical protein
MAEASKEDEGDASTELELSAQRRGRADAGRAGAVHLRATGGGGTDLRIAARRARLAQGRRLPPAARSPRPIRDRHARSHRHLDLPLQAPVQKADGGPAGGPAIVRRVKPATTAAPPRSRHLARGCQRSSHQGVREPAAAVRAAEARTPISRQSKAKRHFCQGTQASW